MPENRGRQPTYGHTVLAVGQVYEFVGDAAAAERVRQAARKWGTKRGARFTVRRILPRRYGCWRLA